MLAYKTFLTPSQVYLYSGALAPRPGWQIQLSAPFKSSQPGCRLLDFLDAHKTHKRQQEPDTPLHGQRQPVCFLSQRAGIGRRFWSERTLNSSGRIWVGRLPRQQLQRMKVHLLPLALLGELGEKKKSPARRSLGLSNQQRWSQGLRPPGTCPLCSTTAAHPVQTLAFYLPPLCMAPRLSPLPLSHPPHPEGHPLFLLSSPQHSAMRSPHATAPAREERPGLSHPGGARGEGTRRPHLPVPAAPRRTDSAFPMAGRSGAERSAARSGERQPGSTALPPRRRFEAAARPAQRRHRQPPAAGGAAGAERGEAERSRSAGTARVDSARLLSRRRGGGCTPVRPCPPARSGVCVGVSPQREVSTPEHPSQL